MDSACTHPATKDLFHTLLVLNLSMDITSQYFNDTANVALSVQHWLVNSTNRFNMSPPSHKESLSFHLCTYIAVIYKITQADGHLKPESVTIESLARTCYPSCLFSPMTCTSFACYLRHDSLSQSAQLLEEVQCLSVV